MKKIQNPESKITNKEQSQKIKLLMEQDKKKARDKKNKKNRPWDWWSQE